MVKPKREKDWLFKTLDDAEKSLGEVIAERYYVAEHTPAERYHDGYEWTWSRESNTRVSPYFETKEEAQAWMDRHEPDDGNDLQIYKQNLYERTVRDWGGGTRV